MSYNLRLADNPAIESTGAMVVDGDLTNQFTTWRDSTRFVGGNWIADGTAELIQPGIGQRGMTRNQMIEFWRNNLGKRIIRTSGGRAYWDGQIVQMQLTVAGQTFIKSIEEIANRIKVIYSKLGPQLLANGDVESGAWGSVGTPSTIETTTAWFAKGTTAMHCVTDAALEGMEIEGAVGISANVPYICSVIVEVTSGAWTLQVLDAATADVITQRATTGSGRQWLQCTIPDSNAITSIDIHLIADDAAREVYADAAVLRTAPVRAETEWTEDADSVALYNEVEGIFLEGEMTDAEADSKAAVELADRAWPRTSGADRGGTFDMRQAPPDNLTVTCSGWVWSLQWKYTVVDGTDQADNHITALAAEWAFASSSTAMIDTNTSEVLIESSNPLTIWRAMEKVLEVGDGSGNAWVLGVYPGFVLRYHARPTTLKYEFRGGRLYHYQGGLVDPAVAGPGYIYLAEMPEAVTSAGSSTKDNPKWGLATEMWFIGEMNGHTRNEWAMEREW